VYPDFVVMRLCGAKEVPTMVKRLWTLVHGGQQYKLADDDFRVVQDLTDKAQREFMVDNGLSAPFSIADVLKIRAYVERCVAESSQVDMTKILFIADDSLASIRRCTVPSRAINHIFRDTIVADCSTLLDMSHALSYDIIIVRETTAKDYVTLRRLQDAGKVIVWDFDEDLFNLPSAHPRAATFTPLDKELHSDLLDMVDFIAVRRAEIGEGLPGRDRAIILPDMVEMDWILPSPAERNPDRFDIVCFTDETRQEDVDILDDVITECIQELPNAHVTFVGCVPVGITEMKAKLSEEEARDLTAALVNEPPGPIRVLSDTVFIPGRVHHIPFPPVKDYYRLLSHMPMDLALAPRTTNQYNAWGSEGDILEMLAKGVPVLASKVGGDGDLFNTGLVEPMRNPEDWKTRIRAHYESTQDPSLQGDRLAETRARYDMSAVGAQWGAALQQLVTISLGRGAETLG
jgi:glycosyltransferase involved in cell wall biosynthesis